MAYSAKVILDSVTQHGDRLTTVEVTYPRMVHSELLTHKMLSRNSSSSRAIPVARLMRQVSEDPAMPVYWGRNQRGMQAREELSGEALERAKSEWLAARDRAVASATLLSGPDVDLHKQIANRLLEPWMFITVLVSATEWDNFFKLRCHPDAQPEMRRAAELMREAREASVPQRNVYHLPFCDVEDWKWAFSVGKVGCDPVVQKLSVARCARVSYLTHDGEHDREKDIALADRLAASGHWSPFEHVATAGGPQEPSANFRGWRQYRKSFPGEDGRS